MEITNEVVGVATNNVIMDVGALGRIYVRESQTTGKMLDPNNVVLNETYKTIGKVPVNHCGDKSVMTPINIYPSPLY